MERYFGTYQTFRTVSKKDAAVLMGSNTLVGDRYRINLTMDEGVHRAWLINKFNETIGYFDDGFSRELSLFAAEGLELVGILSFVAFTETPEPGEYWGQAAVIGYSPHYAEEFNRFIDGVCGLIGKGIAEAGVEGASRRPRSSTRMAHGFRASESLSPRNNAAWRCSKRDAGSSTASWRLDARAIKAAIFSAGPFFLPSLPPSSSA